MAGSTSALSPNSCARLDLSSTTMYFAPMHQVIRKKHPCITIKSSTLVLGLTDKSEMISSLPPPATYNKISPPQEGESETRPDHHS